MVNDGPLAKQFQPQKFLQKGPYILCYFSSEQLKVACTNKKDQTKFLTPGCPWTKVGI